MKKYVSTRILADFMILSNLIGKFLPYQDELKGNALGPAKVKTSYLNCKKASFKNLKIP